MKFLVVFALVIVATFAAPAPQAADVTLLKSEFANDGTDGYSFA